MKFEIDEILVLDSNPEVSIAVAYNEEVGRNAAAYRDSLYASRRLNDEQSITGAHMSVIALKSAGVPIKEGIEIVRQSMQSFRLAALDAALKVAMFQGSFDIDDSTGRPIAIPHFPVSLDPEWANDDIENQRRVKSWVAPFPKRNAAHPIEQQAAYIHALMRENPLMAFRFNNLFTDAANALIEESYNREAAARDGAGFQPR